MTGSFVFSAMVLTP